MAVELKSSDILTPDQLEKHSKIFAGPGAGKTHFLVENIKNIVDTNPLITQSRSRKVLCITYTNAAVDEIKRRLETHAELVEIYTIHGFIIEYIIRPFQYDLKALMQSDFGICVEGSSIISSQVEGLGILHGIEKKEIYDYIVSTTPGGNSGEELHYSKKAMGEVEIDNDLFLKSLRDNQEPERTIKAEKIVENHVLPLKKYIWSVVRKLTHNEILYFGYRILESNPTALFALRVKFPFIFVDEFQDTNPLQTLLVKLLGQRSTILGIVGDVAQSIYSFQGAHPSDFLDFSAASDRETVEYVINGNRRSTDNVVNFCNFLRKSDPNVNQVSNRPYADDVQKQASESKKIHFLLGTSDHVYTLIHDVIDDGGVVITRAWAAAFDYMRGVDADQAKQLKAIYNSYYVTPIKIRDEIVTHNNVTWVKAFRFIINFWHSYENGSFIDALNALGLYCNIDVQKVSPKVIYMLRMLSQEVFDNIANDTLVCNVIERFNSELGKSEYSELKEFLLGGGFAVPMFDEQEQEKREKAVRALHWDTAYKLFTEVFSENSKYMTVHQAKGLEWDKVVVSVTPSKKNDKTTIADLYANPTLLAETPADEFVRMYYVACSRAKEDLYIHISSGCTAENIQLALDSYIEQSGKQIEYELIT